MPVPKVDVERLSQITGWKDAFRVLAVRRCAPLLPDTGVPTAMCAEPTALRRISVRFLESAQEAFRRFADEPWDAWYGQPGEVYRDQIALLAGDALQRTAKEYGESTTRLFYAWARRHFVDESESLRWSGWSRMLPSLAQSRGLSPPLAPSPLSAERTDRFQQVVGRWFGPQQREDLQRKVAQASDIPLSALEQRLTTFEVEGPEDLHEVDVLLNVKLAVDSEWAFRAWCEIDEWVTDAERAAIVEWARNAELAAMGPLDGLPPGLEIRLVSLPDRQALKRDELNRP